jgi:hypothetical protein
MNKVVELHTKPRAPNVREKLDEAERVLAALENEIGPLACDEAEGAPGAAAKLQALNSKINAAQPTKATFGKQALQGIQRHSPSTFYTKLAVDRLFWDKLQILVDPDYRQSFRRAEQAAKKQGSGYWWGPGSGNAPTRAPNPGTAFGK